MATETDLAEKLKMLRGPFEAHQISKLPKPTNVNNPKGKCRECGGWHGLPAVHLDYVGHAALTDRLLFVDPLWTWEPMALTSEGLPLLDKDGGLWIKLTICGITRLGYGDAAGKTGPNATKERIGDALRNAGMRFGIALDLWHKGELHPEQEETPQDAPPAETPAKPLTVVAGGPQAAEEDPLTARRVATLRGFKEHFEASAITRCVPAAALLNLNGSPVADGEKVHLGKTFANMSEANLARVAAWMHDPTLPEAQLPAEDGEPTDADLVASAQAHIRESNAE